MATSDGSDAPVKPATPEPPKPALKLISDQKCFDGWQRIYEHQSEVLKCAMKFAIYLPPGAETAEISEKVPVLYWLSGLTCTELTFTSKAGAQRYAAEREIILVAPDTSPRGCGIEGEDDAYDFGSGAGFYVDATEDKWKTNYNMYSYVTKELPALINANFPARPDKQSIFGHSMGGHGALICALKNPGKYCSVSAFSPICNPINCAWGQKAFTGYLGPDRETWKQYDATELVRKYKGPPLSYVLIDQGKADNFLKDGQLLPENFVEACREGNVPVLLRSHEGYDHLYYFIASFMEDHIKHHAAALIGEEEEEEEEEEVKVKKAEKKEEKKLETVEEKEEGEEKKEAVKEEKKEAVKEEKKAAVKEEKKAAVKEEKKEVVEVVKEEKKETVKEEKKEAVKEEAVKKETADKEEEKAEKKEKGEKKN